MRVLLYKNDVLDLGGSDKYMEHDDEFLNGSEGFDGEGMAVIRFDECVDISIFFLVTLTCNFIRNFHKIIMLPDDGEESDFDDDDLAKELSATKLEQGGPTAILDTVNLSKRRLSTVVILSNKGFYPLILRHLLIKVR